MVSDVLQDPRDGSVGDVSFIPRELVKMTGGVAYGELVLMRERQSRRHENKMFEFITLSVQDM